jgi:ribosomal protein S27E
MSTWPVYDPTTRELIGTVGGRFVQCDTEGCVNFGVSIEFADNGNEIVCGPCGAVIEPATEQP